MARRRKKADRDRPGPSGFLVVDKPAGATSHDVVDAARRWLGIRRIGHLGTLDPQATGVLPLAIRSATKLAPFFQDATKSYVGVVSLGKETDTLDGEGEVLRSFEGELPSEQDVRTALPHFVGDIEQIPPMYSAVKQGGVPLHRLARQGQEVERPPKKVHIERIELLRFDSPELEIAVDCGAGTYVRTLAADLGTRLGCGAYLAGLRRTRSGPFEIEQALDFETCERAAEEGKLEDLLVRPELALGFPVVNLAEPAAQRILNGGDISPGTLHRSRPGTRVTAVGPEGRLLAILELRADRRLWPLRVLPGGGG
jgi:tRNA pseudouridine55 synthase